jgi:hypothetical protein
LLTKKGVFGHENALLRVAGLGGLLKLDVVEHAERHHAGIDEEGVTGDRRTRTGHLTVGNDRDRAEVRQIHVGRGNDRGLALLRGLVTLRRHVAVGHEGREHRLDVGRNHQGFRHAARVVGGQDHRIQNGLGEGALGAVGRCVHNVGRGVVTTRGAARADRVVRGQPGTERAELAVGCAVAGARRRSLVRENDGFHVDAQLDALLGDFAGQFGLAAGLRGLVLGARDDDALVGDLRVVANARRRATDWNVQSLPSGWLLVRSTAASVSVCHSG